MSVPITVCLCVYLSFVMANRQTIGILHDETWRSVNNLYRPSLSALELIMQHVTNNLHYKVMSWSTSPKVTAKVEVEKWNKLIVFANCKKSQNIVRHFRENITHKQSILFVIMEYCKIPKDVSFVYLKSAQDDPPGFQRALVKWLNDEHTQELMKYNGDHISMFKERNLAAKVFLQARSFRLGTLDFLGLVKLLPHQNGTVTQQGLYIDWINDIVQAIKVNYTLILPSNPWLATSVGGWINDSWTELAGMAYRREVDCALYVYVISEKANRDMDILTSAASVINTAILIAAPDFTNDLATIIKPFQLPVWLCLITSVFIIALILGYLNQNGTSYLKVCGNQTVLALQLLLSQGSEGPIRDLSGRLITGAWCIGALICGYLYTSLLTSSIAVPKPYPLVNSLADLAERKTMQPMVFGEDLHRKLFAQANEGVFALLKDAFNKHPENIEVDTNIIVKKVRTGKFAFIGSLTYLQFLIDQDYIQHQRCSITVAKEPVGMELITWLFPKNSATSLVLNLGYLRTLDYGIQPYTVLSYQLKNKFCQKISDYRRLSPVFTLDKTKSLFCILAIGIPIATVCFLCEIYARTFLVA